MWITMCVSGVWHGANYTFIVWGALHALFLTGERELAFISKKIAIPTFIKNILVLMGVLIAWVYFRADNISQANEIVIKMLSFSGRKVSLGNWLSILILIFVLREVYVANLGKIKSIRDRIHFLEPLWVGALAALAFFLRGEGDTFIYFQF